MSKFFDSEIIQDELNEINQLQQTVYGNMISFGTMPREEQVEHVEMLTDLLDKQKVMYTRLSLSDDPDAIRMKEQVEKSIQIMGFPAGTEMQILFEAMTKTIDKLKEVTGLS
tara:strand:+ start:293 stop:628 length:336 start_codon:yes stop_codon:yes gene_type:complete